MHFQATKIKSLKKTFFNVWSGRKRVFMHLCVLPDHQNQVLKKLFFNVWSGSKRVLCICAYLQTTRINSLKKIFFTSGVVKNVFWCISRPPESSPEKIIFSPMEWLKTCFDAFTDHQNQVLQKLFFNVWSG